MTAENNDYKMKSTDGLSNKLCFKQKTETKGEKKKEREISQFSFRQDMATDSPNHFLLSMVLLILMVEMILLPNTNVSGD